MNKVIDPGHRYDLLVLDNNSFTAFCQHLTFVKRKGDNFPGNKNRYPGTTIQSVMRALYDRLGYLQDQRWCLENWIIRQLLLTSVWLLEFRASRRHGLFYFHGRRFAMNAKMCSSCGHTNCRCNKDI